MISKDVIAIVAAVLAMASIAPYLIDILKRKTRPNIVSWSTWTLLTGIATVATFIAGEYRTALLMLGSTLCCGLVVILGFKYGFAKFSKFDALCWAGALLGIFLWFFFESPTLAIITVTTIDCIGIIPTIRHSWLEPQEETWQTFAVSAFASALTILSLEHLSIDGALYPIYLVLGNLAIVVAVIYRRLQKGISLSRHSVHETLHE